MNNLEEMNVNELVRLKVNIEKELKRREELAYNKLLKNFADALNELSMNFPEEYCFVGEHETWEELYHNHSWDF